MLLSLIYLKGTDFKSVPDLSPICPMGTDFKSVPNLAPAPDL